MLKKITLATAVAATLSVVASTGYAQVSVTGSVKASALLSESTKKGDGPALSKTGITRAYSEFYIKYATDLENGWKATAQFGFELLNGRPSSASTTNGVGRSSFSLTQSGNYQVGLKNDTVALVFGDTRYLGAVANYVDGYEFTGLEKIGAYSIPDNPDLSTRNGAVGVSLLSVPNLTLKAGFGTHSGSSTLDGSEDVKDATVLKNSYTEFGLLANYSIAGAKFGLQFVSGTKSYETLADDADALSAAEKNEKVTTNVVVGGSYSLQEVAKVPVNLHLALRMTSAKLKEKGGSAEDVAEETFNVISFGAGYNFGKGNVGLFIDSATYGKKDAGTEYEKAATGMSTVAYVNYSLGATTSVFGSYSATEDKTAEKVAGDATVKTTASALVAGVAQYF